MKNNQCCKDLVFIFQLEEFIDENSGYLGSAAEAGRNAVEAARADLEWTENHKDEILGWLQNEPDVSSSTEPDVSSSSEPDGSTSTTESGSGNIATNTIVITFAFIIALLHNTQIFNYVM